MTPPANRTIAFFVTPHGYGHASRASAVMNALGVRVPGLTIEIFTRVPLWFFNMSLRVNFHYHDVLTDIGLVQANSMVEDLPETIHKLEAFLPFRPALVEDLAAQVHVAGCEMVICDIAPLGIAVAREAGLPSVLVENFTWDWIYSGYRTEEPRFAPYIDYLHGIFAAADTHVRTTPVCSEELPASLTTNPVWREPRSTRAETRARLGVPPQAPMVLVTMGGIVTEFPYLERLQKSAEVRFLIPGGSDRYEQRGSLVLIPHHSDLYHPDLVQACDAVIGKLGYSTLAEAYSHGLPFGFVPRKRFRESLEMGKYAREVMGALELGEEQFASGAWLACVPDLLAQPRREPQKPNGADQVAAYLLQPGSNHLA